MFDPNAELCCEGFIHAKKRFQRCCGYVYMNCNNYISDEEAPANSCNNRSTTVKVKNY